MAEKNLKFGELLSDLTEEDGLNNRELAKIVGVRPSSIGNYRSGREPQAHILEKLADYFKITSKELRSGEITVEKAGSIEESLLDYESPAEMHEANKLLEILRYGTDQDKKIITTTISVLCGDRLWIKQGRPERRKKHKPDHGKPERRLKIHSY